MSCYFSEGETCHRRVSVQSAEDAPEHHDSCWTAYNPAGEDAEVARLKSLVSEGVVGLRESMLERLAQVEALVQPPASAAPPCPSKTAARAAVCSPRSSMHSSRSSLRSLTSPRSCSPGTGCAGSAVASAPPFSPPIRTTSGHLTLTSSTQEVSPPLQASLSPALVAAAAPAAAELGASPFFGGLDAPQWPRLPRGAPSGRLMGPPEAEAEEEAAAAAALPPLGVQDRSDALKQAAQELKERGLQLSRDIDTFGKWFPTRLRRRSMDVTEAPPTVTMLCTHSDSSANLRKAEQHPCHEAAVPRNQAEFWSSSSSTKSPTTAPPLAPLPIQGRGNAAPPPPAGPGAGDLSSSAAQQTPVKVRSNLLFSPRAARGAPRRMPTTDTIPEEDGGMKRSDMFSSGEKMSCCSQGSESVMRGQDSKFSKDTMIIFEEDRLRRKRAVNHSKLRPLSRTCSEVERSTVAQRIVRSSTFEAVMASIIIANAVLVGVEVHWQTKNIGKRVPIECFALQHTFAGIFVLEMAIRIKAMGLKDMFWRRGFGWNHVDAFVIATAIFEVIVDVVYLTSETQQGGKQNGVSQLRIVRMLRITKIIRTLRIQRVIRFIAPLRTLVFSIAATLRSLLWSMILLLMMVFVVGTVITQNTVISLAEGVDEALERDLRYYWLSLDRCMFTLFQSISGGVSWREPIQSLEGMNYVMSWLFTVYISVVYFAVLNVVTGVFVSRAIETTKKNPELVASTMIRSRQIYVENLTAFFAAMDVNDSGHITLRDFEKALKDEEMSAQLHALELDTNDAWTLFKLIDTDKSGLVSIEEFVRGCEELKGSAKGVDMANMSLEFRHLAKKLISFMGSVEDHFASITSQLGDEGAPKGGGGGAGIRAAALRRSASSGGGTPYASGASGGGSPSSCLKRQANTSHR